VNFCRCITQFLLIVYIKPEATFMHGYNHIEHYEEKQHYLTHTHNTTAFQLNIFLTGICQLTTAKVNCKLHSQYLWVSITSIHIHPNSLYSNHSAISISVQSLIISYNVSIRKCSSVTQHQI
jgi:hypothetical protein